MTVTAMFQPVLTHPLGSNISTTINSTHGYKKDDENDYLLNM